MDTDDAYRRDHQAVLDFERLRKAEGLFAWLREIGIMRYGPATPTPAEDLVSIERLRAFQHKVLSFDQVKFRRAHELAMDGLHWDDASEPGEQPPASPLDRHVYAQWLSNTFD